MKFSPQDRPCIGQALSWLKPHLAAFAMFCVASSSAMATVTLEVCFSDGNLQDGSVGILVADVNGNGFFTLSDSSVIGTTLEVGETIGDSDDVILAVFQADSGAHWSGGTGILTTVAALDYDVAGVAENTPLILYTFPDITNPGESLYPGDVANAYRNTTAGGSGGTTGFVCPADPGVYTLAALPAALGGDFDPANPSSDETVQTLRAGVPGEGGGGDDHGDSRTNPTSLTSGAGASGSLTAGDLDYFEVSISGLSQVIAYTTGPLDTIGYLYDPEGNPANNSTADDDAGLGRNFRSTAIIAAEGSVILGVSGRAPHDVGSYVVHFEVIPLPSYRTDLTIGKSAGSQIGNGIYSASGSGQWITTKLKKIKKTRFYFEGQNDGGLVDSIQMRGTRGSKKFRVSYYQTSGGFANVTAGIGAGRYSRSLAPLNRYSFRVDSKGKRPVKKRKRGTLNLAISASSAGGGVDLGRGKVKVKLKRKRR